MLAIGPVLVVAATIGLMYSVATTALGGWLPGVVAAAAVGLAPLLWSQFSLAPSTLYPLPFVAAWLLSIAFLVRTGRLWWAGVAGGALGAGLYMSLPALIMMPCYVALTVIVGWPSPAISRGVAGFLGSSHRRDYLPGVVVDGGPRVSRAMVNAHHLYDANRFNVLQARRSHNLGRPHRAPIRGVMGYLNPAFLFVTGRVLAWPLVVLLPVGIYSLLSARHDRWPVSPGGIHRGARGPHADAEPDRVAIIGFVPFGRTVIGCGGRAFSQSSSRGPRGRVTLPLPRIAAAGITGGIPDDRRHVHPSPSKPREPRVARAQDQTLRRPCRFAMRLGLEIRRAFPQSRRFVASRWQFPFHALSSPTSSWLKYTAGPRWLMRSRSRQRRENS